MTDNSGLHMPYGDDTEEHADEINDELGDDDYEEEQDGEPSDEDIAAQHQRAILFFTDNRLLLSHATATRLRRASAGGSVHDNPPSNSASNDDDDRDDDDDDADPDSHQMQARALLHAIYQPTQRRRSASRAIYQSTQRKQSAPRLRLHQGEHAEQQREGARELLASGEFGAVDSSFGHERVLWGGGGGKGRGEDLGMSEGLAADGERRGGGPSVSLASRIWEREARWKPVSQVSLGRAFVPNQNGELMIGYPERAYSGQYSQDGSFFYTCCQDFRVHIYNTSNPERMQLEKVIQGAPGRWTITDANLSPDNQWIIYSSITPVVYLAKTVPDDDVQTPLDFSSAMIGNAGLWSVRFSNDGREVVAGASVDVSRGVDRCILVYDIESRSVVVSAGGHTDDVNAVCFADDSSQVLLSGSDDTYIKVWDRRSLRGDVPAGVLVGHTEGLTYVASKGDGRYCISNGKDQSMKLWDLRRMTSHKDFEQIERLDLRKDWDYRTSNYPGDAPAHPNDCSVMTYRGHNVVRTLIRCHFSPQHSTGQRYLYTGCADGKIHIYSLDGTVRQVLDAQKAVDNICGRPRRQRTSGLGYYGYSGYGESDITCVRDVSWHPHLPIIMSTSWSGARKHAGIILRHGWEEEAGGA